MSDDRGLDELLFRDAPGKSFGFYDWRRRKKAKNRKGRWRKRDRRKRHAMIRSGRLYWAGREFGWWRKESLVAGTIGGLPRTNRRLADMGFKIEYSK